LTAEIDHPAPKAQAGVPGGENLQKPLFLEEKVPETRYWKAQAAIFLIVIAVAIGLQKQAPQRELFLQINDWAAQFSPALWSGLTLLGDAGVLFALMSPLLLWRPQWLFAVMAAVPLGGLLSISLKTLFDAPRPASLIAPDLIRVTGPLLNNLSFPSGHTITAFAAALAVCQVAQTTRAPAWQKAATAAGLMLAAGVGLSRVAVGAHWPVDVLAGAACGALAGISGARFTDRFPRVWQSPISQFVLGQFLLITAVWLLLRRVEFPLGQPLVWLAAAAALGTVVGQLWVWWGKLKNT
jgi:membrane-associated phospholipid phosphatase